MSTPGTRWTLTPIHHDARALPVAAAPAACYKAASAPGRDPARIRGFLSARRTHNAVPGDPCFVNGRPAVFDEYLTDDSCSVRFPYKDGTLSELRIVSVRRVSRDLSQSITKSRAFALK